MIVKKLYKQAVRADKIGILNSMYTNQAAWIVLTY